MWTSASVVTGIELALARSKTTSAMRCRMEIARTLALPMLRGGEQPHLSQALQAQTSASHRLRELVAWLGSSPDRLYGSSRSKGG